MKSTAILLLASLVTSNEAFIPANGPQVPRNQAITRVRASVDEDPGGINSRREVLSSVAGGILTLGMPVLANALDMDAFANSQIEQDTKNCDPKRDPKCIPKLSQDEALCKYGQSGKARGEACKRVKAAGGELPRKSGA